MLPKKRKQKRNWVSDQTWGGGVKEPDDGRKDEVHVVVEGGPELLQGQKEFPCHRPAPAGVVEQHPQDLGDQLWQVDFELRAQRHGYVLHQQDDGGLEGGVDAPEVLDEVEDGVKVVPDVLLDHIDQAAQLLKKNRNGH